MFWDFKFKKGQPRARSRGFTAIELLVVIGIFTIMTGVVLANLPKFRDQSAVGLVAQQIALVARQAQVYGNSGRQLQGAQVKGYGLYLNLNPVSGSFSDTSFIMFGDKASSGVLNQYNAGSGCGSASTECAERFTLQGGIKITNLRWCDSSGGCTSPPGPLITVVFRRAYPDAQFFSGSGTLQNKSCSIIRIESTRDLNDPNLKKDIVIWSTGHIYTKSVLTDLSFSC